MDYTIIRGLSQQLRILRFGVIIGISKRKERAVDTNFIFSDNGKRYHTYDYFLRKRFGCKVAKLSVDGGFTCPNRDGTKGSGGFPP